MKAIYLTWEVRNTRRRVQGGGCRVREFRVSGAGCEVQGVGYRVWGRTRPTAEEGERAGEDAVEGWIRAWEVRNLLGGWRFRPKP